MLYMYGKKYQKSKHKKVFQSDKVRYNGVNKEGNTVYALLKSTLKYVILNIIANLKIHFYHIKIFKCNPSL